MKLFTQVDILKDTAEFDDRSAQSKKPQAPTIYTKTLLANQVFQLSDDDAVQRVRVSCLGLYHSCKRLLYVEKLEEQDESL